MRKKKKKSYLSYADFHDYYPKFNLGTLVVAICCTCMLISSSFIQLLPGIVTIPEKLITDPINFFNSGFSLKQFALSFNYLPQVPVALFIGALLGPRHGTFAVILYILIALLGYPVFQWAEALITLQIHHSDILSALYSVLISSEKILNIMFLHCQFSYLQLSVS